MHTRDLLGVDVFDPEVYASGDPGALVLDLAKQPNRHLTFATGPHLCMGARIARLELRVLFEELLARTRTIELEGPMEYARDSYVRGVKRLGVRVS